MSIENLANQAAVFALPMRNRFRNTDVRFGAIFQGPSGWAEFAPFPEYSDEVAGRWLAGALEQSHGTWPQLVRQEIPINAIIPIVDVQKTCELVREALAQGMTTVKVKVNDLNLNQTSADVERIAAIRRELDSASVSGKIRIDVNAGWTVQQAIEQLPKLNEAAGGLEYVEQPCDSFEELRELKTAMAAWGTPIRIAVDEGIRLAANIDPQAIREVADIAIIKSLPLGGVARSLEIIERIGLPVIVSGSLDTSIGLVSGLQLAGCVTELAGACGLGTGSLFAADVVSEPLVAQNGVIAVNRQTPDEHLLAHAQPDEATVVRWRERIVRAWNASARDLVSEQIREAVLA